MRKLILVLMMLGLIAGCDQSTVNNGNNAASSEATADRVNPTDNWDHSRSYSFSGTASERVTDFGGASTDLQIKINELNNRTTDGDIREKLSEANEKIAEAREKLAKADKKSIEGNTKDAIEKTEEAREKLEEAREKYMEALEKLEE